MLHSSIIFLYVCMNLLMCLHVNLSINLSVYLLNSECLCVNLYMYK